MQVFKVSMAILKRNIPSIMVYVMVFLVLAILFSTSAQDRENEYASFDAVKTNVAVFSDEDTPLVDGFLSTLKENANLVPVDDDKNAMADALYFRVVTYIIRIPKGFTDTFMKDGDMALETMAIPGSAGNTYTELGINTFFNTARLFLSADNTLSPESLVQKTILALNDKTLVSMESMSIQKPDNYAMFYFNFMAFSLVSILILGSSIVMLVWKDKDLSRRTEVSPLPKVSALVQKYLALGLFALLVWFILFVTYFVISRKPWEENTILYLANSLIFTFTTLALSFLVGGLLTSRNAVSAVSNVIALGPAFISGVFVPQELLNQSVLNIAKATPTYWYVSTNNTIESLTSLTFQNLNSIFVNMFIVGLFGVGFLLLSALVDQRKSKEI